jgi:hypothetical protein
MLQFGLGERRALAIYFSCLSEYAFQNSPQTLRSSGGGVRSSYRQEFQPRYDKREKKCKAIPVSGRGGP